MTSAQQQSVQRANPGAVSQACQLCVFALAGVLAASCGGGGDGGGSGGGGGSGVAVGKFFACALRSGGVWCWGWNEEGQLGDGTTEKRGKAMPVLGLSSGVQAITAGSYHACALLRDRVMCWGYNGNWQLGSPDGQCRSEAYSSTPVRVAGLGAGVQALAAGGSHTCALVNGGVQCWGDDSRGQLGVDGDRDSCAPVPIPGLGSGVTAISAGSKHTCAVVNGGVKCWGGDQYGQLGDGNYGSTTFYRSTPYTAIPEGSGATAVAVTERYSCAIVGQELKCWGAPLFGGPQFATTCSPHCTPVKVMDVRAGTTSLGVNVGTIYLLANGGVKAAGLDGVGELGNGEPRTDSAALVDVSGLTAEVEAIGAGEQSACALLEGGEVRCWGWNEAGELGDETTTNRAAPVTVHGL